MNPWNDEVNKAANSWVEVGTVREVDADDSAIGARIDILGNVLHDCLNMEREAVYRQ